ncbi:hypothetical protein ADK67_14700 [Saccharothrix sp. NRRL B-16348]|nr:hypothetical protein ADK67_14700 [Saccharothrix sp. NRRL B-16348]
MTAGELVVQLGAALRTGLAQLATSVCTGSGLRAPRPPTRPGTEQVTSPERAANLARNPRRTVRVAIGLFGCGDRGLVGLGVVMLRVKACHRCFSVR